MPRCTRPLRARFATTTTWAATCSGNGWTRAATAASRTASSPATPPLKSEYACHAIDSRLTHQWQTTFVTSSNVTSRFCLVFADGHLCDLPQFDPSPRPVHEEPLRGKALLVCRPCMSRKPWRWPLCGGVRPPPCEIVHGVHSSEQGQTYPKELSGSRQCSLARCQSGEGLELHSGRRSFVIKLPEFRKHAMLQHLVEMHFGASVSHAQPLCFVGIEEFLNPCLHVLAQKTPT